MLRIALLAAVVVASAVWAPPWVTALIVLGLGTYGYWRARQLPGAVRDGLRRSKAHVLQLATVTVHEVSPAEVRDGVQQYEVELTLSPRSGVAQSRSWEPSQLRFVSKTAKSVDVIRVHQRVGRDLSQAPDAVKGAQRLRLLAEWPPGTEQVMLSYYDSGIVEVPLAPRKKK